MDQESIKELYQGVLHDISTPTASSDKIDYFFSSVKPTKQVFDFIKKNQWGYCSLPETEKSNDIFSCLDVFSSFIGNYYLSRAHSRSLLLSIIPFHSLLLKITSCPMDYSENTLLAYWTAFTSKFNSVYCEVCPCQLNGIVLDLFGEIEEAISILYKEDERSAHYKTMMGKLNVFFTENEIKKGLKDKIKVLIFDTLPFLKNYVQTHLKDCEIPIKLLASLKSFEETITWIEQFNNIIDRINTLRNSQISEIITNKPSPENQKKMIQITIKLYPQVFRELYSFYITKEGDIAKWYFSSFEQLMSIQNLLSLSFDGDIYDQWNVFLNMFNSHYSNIDTKLSQQTVNKTLSDCILASDSIHDFNELLSVYEASEKSPRNLFFSHKLYIEFLSLEKKIDRIESHSSFNSLLQLTKNRLLYNFLNTSNSLLSTIIGTYFSKKTSQMSVSECVPLLIYLVNFTFPKNTYPSFFLGIYRQYLEFIKDFIEISDSEEFVNELLSFHPSQSSLWNHLLSFEDIKTLLSDIGEMFPNYLMSQNVLLQFSEFGSYKWFQRASSLVPLLLWGKDSVNNLLLKFDKISQFFSIVGIINNKYGNKGCHLKLRENEDSFSMSLHKVFVNLKKLPFINVYNVREGKEIRIALIPILLKMLYYDFNDEKEHNKSLNVLSHTIFIPRCPEVLASCYQVIEYFEECQRSYPELSIILSEIRLVFFSTFTGGYSQMDSAKLLSTKLNTEASRICPQLQGELDSKYKNIQKYLVLFSVFIPISECLSQITEAGFVLTINSIVKVMTEANHIELIRSSLSEAFSCEAIDPSSIDICNRILEEINTHLPNNLLIDIYLRSSNQNHLSSIISKFGKIGNIVMPSHLLSYFRRLKPVFTRLLKQSPVLANSKIPKSIYGISKALSEFTLSNNYHSLSHISSLITQIENECKSESIILEYDMLLKYICRFAKRVHLFRTIYLLQEYPSNINSQKANAIYGSLIQSSLHKLSLAVKESGNVFQDKARSQMIFLDPASIESIEEAAITLHGRTPDDFVQAKLYESERINADAKMEFQSSEGISDSFRYSESQLQSLHAMFADNQNTIHSLTNERERIKMELISLEERMRGTPLDSQIPESVSMFFTHKELINQLTQVNHNPIVQFLDNQIHEALKSNIRLKKHLALLDFPRESPVMSHNEFIKLVEQFREQISNDIPIVSTRANDSANKRSELKELQNERDQCFRKLASMVSTQKSSSPRRTEAMFNELYAMATANRELGTRKNQREAFVEFADLYDQFLLEVSEELAELEIEKRRIINKAPMSPTPEEKRGWLLNRLNNIDP